MKQFYPFVSNRSTFARYFICMLGLMLLSFFAPVNSSYGQNVLNSADLDASVTEETAYSLRKQSTSYNGFAIKVRKTTTPAITTNIGLTTAGDLNTLSLKTFAGLASALVTKWYYQSGKGRDAAQVTANKQEPAKSTRMVSLLLTDNSIFLNKFV